MAGNDSTDVRTRKLQKVGGGTFTVSLPKGWVTEQSLSAGDRVRVYPDGDGSLVVCRGADAAEEATATVSGTAARDFQRLVSAAYAAGVDRLVLRPEEGFADEERRRLEGHVRTHTGMRVAEATETAVDVRTMLDDEQVSAERTVVQLQFVALSLFRTAADGAVGAATVDDDRVADRRAEAVRLRSLVSRQFQRSLSRPGAAGALGVDRATAFAFYRTARELEDVAAAAVDLAHAAEGCEGTPALPATFRSVADGLRLFLEDATGAVVEGRALDDVRELYGTADSVSTAIDELRSSDEGECPHARDVVAALATCAVAGERIVDVACEAALSGEV